MSLRLLPIACALGVTWGLLCLSARADGPVVVDVDRQAADKLILEGKKLGDAGRVMEAIERFKAAEARYPRAIHGCNIGLAYAQLKSFPQALLFLEQCRSRATGPLPAWVEARYQKTLETLRTQGYGAIEIVTDPPGADIAVVGFAKDETFVAPRTVWLSAGEGEIVVSRDGYVTEKRTLQVTPQAQRLLVRLQRVPVAIAPPRPTDRTTEPNPPTTIAQPLPAPEPPRGRTSLKIAGGVVAGVSLVAMFGAFGSEYASLKSAYVASVNDGQLNWQERRNSFVDKRNHTYQVIYPAIFVTTGVGILAGVAIAVAGVILPASKSSRVSAVLVPGLAVGGATMNVVGRF